MKKWETKDNHLIKTFEFEDFKQAWGFMSKVALVAEKQNHHPNWSNVYNQVEIKLNTHDADDQVTEKDHKLAEAIDAVY